MADPAPQDQNIDSSAQEAEKSSPAQDDKPKAQPNSPVSKDIFFNSDITIHTDQPLTQYDKGTVRAFRATGRNKIAGDLIAYLCDRSLTPRVIDSPKYSKIRQPSLVQLVAKGKVLWPQSNSEKFCLIYANTLGKPVLSIGDKSSTLGWKAEDVINNVAHPLIAVLTNMRNVDLVHGEIWPGNLYFNGDPAADKVTLGECLSTPSSFNLPALYEPIERAMANPIGRGPGSLTDDLYSLGVCLAVMIRKNDPMAGASEQEIIAHKIEKGSYVTLLSKDRLSGATLELLRGLLYDDPEQRWTIDDIESWMDGRRLSPKQSPKRVKASRPLVLHEVKYTRPELFAQNMTEHADEAARMIERGDIMQWLERAIEDKAVKVRTEQMMDEIKNYDRTDGYNARISAAIATALYPEMPIHYRSLKFHGSAFGKALTHAYIHQKDFQDYTDILRNFFIISCLRLKATGAASALITKFDACRNYINQTALNSGLERCLYYLNPESPCLSPILERYHVMSPEDFLIALEDICKNEKPNILFDRHIYAFLSLKDRRNLDPYLADLSSSDTYKRRLGQLRVLATIQKRSGLEKAPNLADWLVQNMIDVFDRFHDAKKRQSIQDQINKIKKNGDLTKIALFFEDPKIFQTDLIYFYQAMKNYKSLEEEKEKIQAKLDSGKNFGHRSGEQVASVVAMVAAFIIMVISAYIIFVKG